MMLPRLPPPPEVTDLAAARAALMDWAAGAAGTDPDSDWQLVRDSWALGYALRARQLGQETITQAEADALEAKVRAALG